MIMTKKTNENNEIYKIISLVLGHNVNLINLVLNKNKTRLRDQPEVILEKNLFLSSGEIVLLKVAIDLWSGTSFSSLYDLIYTLDRRNFENIMHAIRIMSNKVMTINDFKDLFSGETE